MSCCPNCGAQSVIGQRFCGTCGAPLVTGCPYCGVGVVPGARFCTNCGTYLAGGVQQRVGLGAYQQEQQRVYEYKVEKPKQKKTSSGLICCLGLMGIVLLVVGAGFAADVFPFGTPSAPPPVPQSTPSPPVPPSTVNPPISSSTPTYNIGWKDWLYDSRYWNTSWDVNKLWQTLYLGNKSYHKEHPYIKDRFDCNDMVVDMWDELDEQGIISVIVVGNLDLENESFADCDHAWLLVMHEDNQSVFRLFALEMTNGESFGIDPKSKAFRQYMMGYFYSSPSDLRADVTERW